MVEKTMDISEWSSIAEDVVKTNNCDANALIAILQDTQKQIGYLPKEVMEVIADSLDIPVSRVYAVATFYSGFKLKPVGRNIIKVCLGTACHIKGGPKLMDELERQLGIPPHEMTPDGKFSYEPVRCVGCCGLAPVIMVNEKFHGKVAPKDIKKILDQYE